MSLEDAAVELTLATPKKGIIHGILNASWKICSLVVKPLMLDYKIIRDNWFSIYFPVSIYFVLLMKSHLQSYPCPLQINSFLNQYFSNYFLIYNFLIIFS